MHKVNLDEIKRMDAKSIKVKVSDLKKEISGLILDKNTNKLKDLKVISKRKRDIAQMLTILNQKLLIEKLQGKEEVK